MVRAISALDGRDPNSQLTRIADKPSFKATKEKPAKRSEANVEALKEAAESSVRQETTQDSPATPSAAPARMAIPTSQAQPDFSALFARLDAFLEIQRHQQQQINALINAVNKHTLLVGDFSAQLNDVEGGIDTANRNTTYAEIHLDQVHKQIVKKDMAGKVKNISDTVDNLKGIEETVNNIENKVENMDHIEDVVQDIRDTLNEMKSQAGGPAVMTGHQVPVQEDTLRAIWQSIDTLNKGVTHISGQVYDIVQRLDRGIFVPNLAGRQAYYAP
ncbi:hypothetical protein PRZ48_009832 [Zasmidium cellare]|uniref:Uncharacterized protein n=1 Tax=Zasmidium cellare TaxID=395010 RepID=A0ABR0ED78_ZASCE|nr:hypothetical protein PRZ48_009832 [Zasmidium cellare]